MTEHQKLTPPEVARIFRVDAKKVISWIRSGELRAVNVATRIDGRPRYVIDREDIAAFELRRQVVPPAPRRRRYRREYDHDVIKFY
ncbi:MAG: helix-turn-helix domain-containing protein [Phycisphaerae bacterium]|nr:helix-turn-helix domain-containing protein [Phycisphaerae bacterium]